MSKLRIAYIASLVILGLLIAFAVFRPMVVGGEYSTVQRAQFLESKDQWIIQFDLINHEGRDQNYTITVVVDGKQHNQSILIRDGRMFTYIHHFYRDRVTEDNIRFAIYKEGAATPFEEITYYLKW